VCVCVCVCVFVYVVVCALTVAARRACVQVRRACGIPIDPHVVVLEAGLDGRAFPEDLPVAPWL
jgi:hypothetical protein